MVHFVPIGHGIKRHALMIAAMAVQSMAVQSIAQRKIRANIDLTILINGSDKLVVINW